MTVIPNERSPVETIKQCNHHRSQSEPGHFLLSLSLSLSRSERSGTGPYRFLLLGMGLIIIHTSRTKV